MANYRDVPVIVEIGGAALLALRLEARGADSTRGKQRHEQTYHIHRDSCESGQDRSADEYDGEFRKFLCFLWNRGTSRDYENRRANGVRPATRAPQEPNGASLGQDERQDWLSRRQGGDLCQFLPLEERRRSP